MLKYFISIFFAFPIFLSSLISLYFIDYPDEFKRTPYILIGIAIALFVFDILLHQKKNLPSFAFKGLEWRTLQLAQILGYIIVSLCLLDLVTHGLVILSPNPMAYFTFTPFEHHLRHFSSLVWILAPLAFFIKSKLNRTLFFISAFLFPVLFLDRNRLLLSLFAMGLTLLLFDKYAKNKFFIVAVSTLVAIGGPVAFSLLGTQRVQQANAQEDYLADRNEQINKMQIQNQSLINSCPVPRRIPLNDHFTKLSGFMRWTALYISSPVFNLATVDFCDFRNSEIFKSQILPYYQPIHIIENVPFVAPYLNTATELLPFQTLGGWALSIFIFILTYFILFFLIQKLVSQFDIFYYLIFLRIAYCAVFFNFAPQFYTWSTFGFVFVMLALKLINGYIRQAYPLQIEVPYGSK